jgi:hypothetical protein
MLIPPRPIARDTGLTGGSPTGSPPIVRFASAISARLTTSLTLPLMQACSWAPARSSPSEHRRCLRSGDWKAGCGA